MGTSMILCLSLKIGCGRALIMPRKARIDAPGVLHHVIVRGNRTREDFSI